MANNIIKYKGNNIGKSIKEENCETIIKNILKPQKIILVKLLSLRMFWLEKV